MFSFHVHSLWNAKACLLPRPLLHHPSSRSSSSREWGAGILEDGLWNSHGAFPGERRTDPVILRFSMNTYNPDAQIQWTYYRNTERKRGEGRGIFTIESFAKRVIKKYVSYQSGSFLHIWARTSPVRLPDTPPGFGAWHNAAKQKAGRQEVQGNWWLKQKPSPISLHGPH